MKQRYVDRNFCGTPSRSSSDHPKEFEPEVLSMFVLRASPVFLGEMNGTATALVRCATCQLGGIQGLIQGKTTHPWDSNEKTASIALEGGFIKLWPCPKPRCGKWPGNLGGETMVDHRIQQMGCIWEQHWFSSPSSHGESQKVSCKEEV